MFECEYNGNPDPRLSCFSVEKRRFLNECRKKILRAPRRYGGTTQGALKRSVGRREVQEALMVPGTWQAMAQGFPPEGREKIKSLEQRFMRHGVWACYSSEALYQIAFDVVPALAAYLIGAQQELTFYNDRMDRATSVAADTFLAGIAQWIKESQISLTHAMAERLIVASRAGDRACDDVIQDTLIQLQACGALEGKPLPVPHRGLQARYLNAFQRYIGKGYAKAALKGVQRDVTWLKHDPQYVTRRGADGIYAMPMTLQPMVPRSRWAHWFGKLTDKLDIPRYWRARQHLIATLRCVQAQVIAALKAHDIPVLIQTMGRLHRELSNEQQQIQLRKQRRWWLFGEYRTLTALNTYYQEGLSVVVDKSLALLSHQLDLWESQWALSECFTLNKTAASTVMPLMELISTLKKKVGLSTAQRAAMKRSDQRFNTLHQKQHNEQVAVPALLRQIAQDPFSGRIALTPLYDHAHQLQCVVPLKFKALQRQAHWVRNAAVALLQHSAKHLIAGKDPLPEGTLKRVGHAVLLIKKLGTQADRDQVYSLVQPLQQAWAQHGCEIATQRDLDTQSLLLTVAVQLGFRDIQSIMKPIRPLLKPVTACQTHDEETQDVQVAPSSLSLSGGLP